MWTRRNSTTGPRCRWLGAAAVAACAVALAACGSSSSSSSATAATAAATNSGSSGGTTSITVGLPVVDATFIPVWLAQAEGYYKQQGLNVSIVTFHGGADLTKAVVGGSVDLGVNGLGGIMPAVLQGQSVKVVYGGFDEVSYQWLAAKNIHTVAQAAHKTWGVTKIGSDTDFMSRYVLVKNGLSPTTGANIIQGIVSPATALAALSTGQIQVAALAQDNDAPVKAAGYNLIASETDYTSQYPDHMVFAQASYISSHSATITKFLRALSEAIAYEKSHPAQTEAAMVKYEAVPQKYVAASYASFVGGQYPDGRIPDAAGMNFFWHVGISNGEFKSVVPESKWLDPQWINTYNQWSKQ
jgi:NitT/TauT family transport system substrate-binding protein